jgi:hypothetical protein
MIRISESNSARHSDKRMEQADKRVEQADQRLNEAERQMAFLKKEMAVLQQAMVESAKSGKESEVGGPSRAWNRIDCNSQEFRVSDASNHGTKAGISKVLQIRPSTDRCIILQGIILQAV